MLSETDKMIKTDYGMFSYKLRFLVDTVKRRFHKQRNATQELEPCSNVLRNQRNVLPITSPITSSRDRMIFTIGVCCECEILWRSFN